MPLSEFVVGKVAPVLLRGEGRTLGEVTHELNVSRVTTIKWLRSMEKEGLLHRTYQMKGKRGRPRGVYHPTKNLRRFVEAPNNGSMMVTLSFATIRGMCRHRAGAVCKALTPKIQNCDSSLCPYLKA